MYLQYSFVEVHLDFCFRDGSLRSTNHTVNTHIVDTRLASYKKVNNACSNTNFYLSATFQQADEWQVFREWLPESGVFFSTDCPTSVVCTSCLLQHDCMLLLVRYSGRTHCFQTHGTEVIWVGSSQNRSLAACDMDWRIKFSFWYVKIALTLRSNNTVKSVRSKQELVLLFHVSFWLRFRHCDILHGFYFQIVFK